MVPVPNPTTAEFKLPNISTDGLKSVIIVNTLGQQVLKLNNIEAGQILKTNLSKGIYIFL